MLCYEYLSRIAYSVIRLNCYRRGSCVEGPVVRLIPHSDTGVAHASPPTRQPPPWFIDIALKLGAQLSISIVIFQVFGMTRL